MKIARFNAGALGLVDGAEIVDVSALLGANSGEWPPMAANRLIAGFAQWRPELESALATAPRYRLDEVRLLTPIPWPNKVIAYPVNYHAHGQEMQAGYRASNQGFFLKPGSSLVGASDQIELPALPDREVHHECELGIVIGREVRGATREQWRDCIFGYTCLMDIVVRGREERVMRKAYDTFCPVGPWVVTADEVPTPEALEMKLWVNEELRQHANTADLVLDIPGMVATASAVMTLYPGDIIATGTPEGVGPIRDGDQVRIWIENVGEMTLGVVQGNRGWSDVFQAPYTPPTSK